MRKKTGKQENFTQTAKSHSSGALQRCYDEEMVCYTRTLPCLTCLASCCHADTARLPWLYLAVRRVLSRLRLHCVWRTACRSLLANDCFRREQDRIANGMNIEYCDKLFECHARPKDTDSPLCMRLSLLSWVLYQRIKNR